MVHLDKLAADYRDGGSGVEDQLTSEDSWKGQLFMEAVLRCIPLADAKELLTVETEGKIVAGCHCYRKQICLTLTKGGVLGGENVLILSHRVENRQSFEVLLKYFESKSLHIHKGPIWGPSQVRLGVIEVVDDWCAASEGILRAMEGKELHLY